MNEISCDICRDLMPLVSDGVASEESRQAVENHIMHCSCCAQLYEQAPPKPDHKAAYEKIKLKSSIFLGMILMLGTVYGLSLTASNGLFYNILLMPVVGALGYGIFRWKAAYIIPIFLYVTHFLTNYLGFAEEILDIASLLLWTLYYCLFALLGTGIAWLLHFAFKKEDSK